MKTTTTMSNERFQEVCRFMHMADMPKKKTIINPVVVPIVEEAITKEGAFQYIHSIKEHINIEDSSFIINYEYMGADIEMVVIDGDVYHLEINPILKAWNIAQYKHLPVYTQIKRIA